MVIKTYENEKYLAEVGYEECPISPREYDNLFELIVTQYKGCLGDTRMTHDTFYTDLYIREYKNTPRTQKSAKKKLEKDYLIAPVYIYEHSGLVFSIRPFSNTFDSWQLGYAVCSKKILREELQTKRVTPKYTQKALNILKAELEEYQKYLNGEVMYVTITDKGTGDFNSYTGFYDIKSLKASIIDKELAEMIDL